MTNNSVISLYQSLSTRTSAATVGSPRQKVLQGLFITLVGPCTFWPVLAMSKRQTVVSRSSTESEVTAVDTALRTEAISILYFLHQVQGVLENTAPDAGGGSPGPAPHDRRKITSAPEFTEFAQKQSYDKTIQSASLIGRSKLEASTNRMKMLVLEDNEAAIKILEKRPFHGHPTCGTHAPDINRMAPRSS